MIDFSLIDDKNAVCKGISFVTALLTCFNVLGKGEIKKREFYDPS